MSKVTRIEGVNNPEDDIVLGKDYGYRTPGEARGGARFTGAQETARFWQQWSVYEIVHRETGRCYVGMSSQPVGRWNFHLADAFVNGKQTALGHALRALGPEAFDFRILETCPDEEVARDREKWWIAQRVRAGVPLYNSLLTLKRGFGPHGEGNPYIDCDCSFRTGGHVCAPYLKRSRKPSARAYKVTPEKWDVMQRLRAMDVSLKKIALALDLSIGAVHRYLGEDRAIRKTKTSEAV